MASGLHSLEPMRNALLVALVPVFAVAALSVGCGDASSSTGIQRNRGAAAPVEGTQQDHDPNAGDDETPEPSNPNASTPPPAPATPGTAAGELGVTLSNATPAADLGTTLDLDVVVEPKAGFKGDADLTVTGLPTGVTATFNPAKVTLNTTKVTSKLSLKVPFSTTATAPGAASALVVKATSGAISATANANFKVNPKISLTIPVNADALRAAGGTKYVDGWGGPDFGSTPATLSTQNGNGIVVVVKNADSAAHIVHGQAGFAHGNTGAPVAPGATDPLNRTINPPAGGQLTPNGYLHDGANGTSVAFRFTVKAVN